MTDHRSPIPIRTGCPAHNCGGRYLLIAHIQDGKIADDPEPDWQARRGW